MFICYQELFYSNTTHVQNCIKLRRHRKPEGREKEKKHLEVLRQQASAPSATSSVQSEYHAASERRRKLLKYSREIAAS